jgi:hypothetical protein
MHRVKTLKQFKVYVISLPSPTETQSSSSSPKRSISKGSHYVDKFHFFSLKFKDLCFSSNFSFMFLSYPRHLPPAPAISNIQFLIGPRFCSKASHVSLSPGVTSGDGLFLSYQSMPALLRSNLPGKDFIISLV